MFGEEDVILRKKRTYSVRAMSEDTLLYRASRKEFKQFLNLYKEAKRTFVQRAHQKRDFVRSQVEAYRKLIDRLVAR